jgi:hypothetical protein
VNRCLTISPPNRLPRWNTSNPPWLKTNHPSAHRQLRCGSGVMPADSEGMGKFLIHPAKPDFGQQNRGTSFEK